MILFLSISFRIYWNWIVSISEIYPTYEGHPTDKREIRVENGRKKMHFQFSPENQEMDISHLEQGVYILEIRGKNLSKRLVKIIKY